MKTKTDEVDALAKLTPRDLKWYAVRPPLLAILLTEVLTAVGLVALDPYGIRHWIGRLLSSMSIGVAGIEVMLLCLAGAFGLWAASRARSGERPSFRRSEAEGLSLAGSAN